MDIIKRFKNYISFNLIFNLFLIPFVICSFKRMKKISDNNDYFVILDDGLYIYNFEKSKCETITNLDKSIFYSNDEYNNIVITKNSNPDSNKIKIAALINQHLFVYSNNNINCDYKIIESLADNDHYIYPFYVKIDDYKLIIILYVEEEGLISSNYYIKVFEFENYLSIKNNEPKIKEHDDDYSNKLVCQFDSDELLIRKCQRNFY